MKTRSWIMAILVAAGAIVLAATPSGAAGLKAGATVWYTWWDGANRSISTGAGTPLSTLNRYHQVPAILYGPVLSVDFNQRWSLSVIFALGTDIRARGSYYEPWMSGYHRLGNRYFRYDLDPTAAYAFNRYVKVFAGMKLQGYDIDGTSETYYSNRFEKSSPKTKYIAYGPGAGIGLTVPLHENLFVIANVSGLYMRSDITRKELITVYGTVGQGNDASSTNGRFAWNVWGGNANASLAWYVPRASLTFSLGGRYQLFWIQLAGNHVSNRTTSIRYGGVNLFAAQFGEAISEYIARHSYHGKYDHFYGITFSTIYSFDFSKT